MKSKNYLKVFMFSLFVFVLLADTYAVGQEHLYEYQMSNAQSTTQAERNRLFWNSITPENYLNLSCPLSRDILGALLMRIYILLMNDELDTTRPLLGSVRNAYRLLAETVDQHITQECLEREIQNIIVKVKYRYSAAHEAYKMREQEKELMRALIYAINNLDTLIRRIYDRMSMQAQEHIVAGSYFPDVFEVLVDEIDKLFFEILARDFGYSEPPLLTIPPAYLFSSQESSFRSLFGY